LYVNPLAPDVFLASARFLRPIPIISEKKASVAIWIGEAVFTIGAILFGH